MSDDLRLRGGIVIPAGELEWRFTTSGGPGGQHANRSATRAELRFDLAGSGAVDEERKQHMLSRLGPKAPGGVVTVSVDDTRSQWRNRALARRRLAELLTDALRVDRVRRPTGPSRAAKRRRLESKRRRGEIKRLRKPPEPS